MVGGRDEMLCGEGRRERSRSNDSAFATENETSLRSLEYLPVALCEAEVVFEAIPMAVKVVHWDVAPAG